MSAEKTRSKANPLEQKAKLIEQLKEIESKLADFDNQRLKRIAALAKRYKLTDLSDEVLEKEFCHLRDKYRTDSKEAVLQSLADDKKKS